VTFTLPCIEGTIINYPGSSAVRSCVLSEDAVVQGMPFKAGSIVGFNEDSRLWRCNIAENTVINSLPCKAKTEVEFSSEGILLSCILSDDFEIMGIPAMSDKLVLFHPNGNLFKCNIRHEIEFEGFVLAPETDICFFDDKRPSAFTLYENALIKGIPCLAGTRVWLYKNGNIAGCTISDDLEINDVVYNRGSFVVFDKKGDLIKLHD
jgi:hypothetical protein